MKGKRKKKKIKKPNSPNPMKKKKRGSKVAAESDRGIQYVVLIMEMPLKTKL